MILFIECFYTHISLILTFMRPPVGLLHEMDYIVLSRPELASQSNADLNNALIENECRCYAIHNMMTEFNQSSISESLLEDESALDSADKESQKPFDYLVDVQRTADECRQEYLAPQRSAKWHAARKYTLTASNFGSAAGHNRYCSPQECALEKVKNEFQGNEATEYGTKHEPDARNFLLKLLNSELYETLKDQYTKDTGGALTEFHLEECGLMKHSDQPWMGASPDGILKLDGTKGPTWILIEYKCPFSKKDSSEHPYKMYPKKIPEYYYDQIQGIMGYLQKFKDSDQYRKINACLFVVWQPRQMHITKFLYDANYYVQLESLLHKWYFELYLPMIVPKASTLSNTDELKIYF